MHVINLLKDDNIKRYSHYSGVYNTKSLNGVINDNFNYDAWLVNYALIKSTGTFTDTKCEHINNCTTILEVIIVNFIKI